MGKLQEQLHAKNINDDDIFKKIKYSLTSEQGWCGVVDCWFRAGDTQIKPPTWRSSSGDNIWTATFSQLNLPYRVVVRKTEGREKKNHLCLPGFFKITEGQKCICKFNQPLIKRC